MMSVMRLNSLEICTAQARRHHTQRLCLKLEMDFCHHLTDCERTMKRVHQGWHGSQHVQQNPKMIFLEKRWHKSQTNSHETWISNFQTPKNLQLWICAFLEFSEKGVWWWTSITLSLESKTITCNQAGTQTTRNNWDKPTGALQYPKRPGLVHRAWLHNKYVWNCTICTGWVSILGMPNGHLRKCATLCIFCGEGAEGKIGKQETHHDLPPGSCPAHPHCRASQTEGSHPKLPSALQLARASTLANIKCGYLSSATSPESFQWSRFLLFPLHATLLSANLWVLAYLHRCTCSSSYSAHSMKQPWGSTRQVWVGPQSADGQRETARAHQAVWPPGIRKIPTCWWPPSPRNFPTRAELYEDLCCKVSSFLGRLLASWCTSWHPGFAPIRLALPAARNPLRCGGETASGTSSDLTLARMGKLLNLESKSADR